MRRFSLVVAAAATAAGCQQPPPVGPEFQISSSAGYEIIDLGWLKNAEGRVCTGSEALAVNNRGQVVGYSRIWFRGEQDLCWYAPKHAFFWENGVMTDLGTLGGEASWASVASYINDRGQVAGWALTATSQLHAFFWEGGTMQDVGTLGGGRSEATGLGPSGQVIGWSTTASGDVHGFLWQAGTLLDLGTLGGATTRAASINSAGQIVGSSTLTTGETRAFLWEAGVMRDLGTLGGTYSAATAISDGGWVAGASTSEAGDTLAFVWHDGVMQNLGTLPGQTSSSGVAVNALGQVTGRSGGRGFFWSHGVMHDLGDLGGAVTVPNALDGRGLVAGRSKYISACCGFDQAFVWESGVMTGLPFLGSVRNASVAWATNARGDIVGMSRSGTERWNAVLWRRRGGVDVARAR